MTPERWQEIEALFHAVHDCPAPRRAELLARADPDTRRDVESLLEDAARTGPLDRLAMDVLDSARLAPGMSLGPYRIISTLGRGGMGEVYRARDTKLERDVAIKVLPAVFVSDPARVARFQEEAKALAALNHPNIAAIYGLEERDGTTALVLELVEGPTLAERLEQGPIPLQDAMEIAAQVADALHAAHERGIIHRDLKPANIKLRPDGKVKVLDFGLAKRPFGIDTERRAEGQAETSTGLTDDGVILGTVGYMSPEQAGGTPTDFGADQFSFGVICFELLTGRRPFDRATPAETVAAIARDDPPAIQTLNPAATGALQDVVTRCLAKHPRQRYASSRQLAFELHRLKNLADAGASRDITRRRSSWMAGVVLAMFAAGATLWRPWPADPGVRVLAVLPFANVAGDEGIEYLCDGITESLIQQISRLPSLTVMAWSTVSNFKNTSIDMREAGRQLGADAILTGTVSRPVGGLRITAELVEVATGARLWGNTYELASEDLVAIQDEIANAIIDEGIQLPVNGSERRALTRHSTSDPEAYEWYLRARHATFGGTERDLLEARALLERATTRDPRFAQAYKLLAANYVAMALNGYERPTEAFPHANRNINRALEIDPQAPEAHSTKGSIAFFFDWDWETAEREWTLGDGLPNDGLYTQELVGHSYGRWVMAGPRDALRLVRRLRRVDPLTVSYAVLEADYLFHAAQLDEAAALYQKTLGDEPTAGALFGLAEVRRAQGRFDDAIEVRHRAHEAAGDDFLNDVRITARGAAGYRQLEKAALEYELDALRSREAAAYVSPLDFARAYARLGEVEKAFSYFDQAFADRAPGLVFLEVDPAWENIRDDSRFAAAVRRVDLP